VDQAVVRYLVMLLVLVFRRKVMTVVALVEKVAAVDMLPQVHVLVVLEHPLH
jgi:hypothetical protein